MNRGKHTRDRRKLQIQNLKDFVLDDGWYHAIESDFKMISS